MGLYLCLKYLHRHPVECPGLSIRALADLAAFHEEMIEEQEGEES